MKKHTRSLGKSVTLALCLFATPALAQTAECSDGRLSNGTHPLNTCSRHGKVRLYEELAEEAKHRLDAAQELPTPSSPQHIMTVMAIRPNGR